jgi:hypothetical protein
MSISEHKHMPEPVRRIEVFTGATERYLARRARWISKHRGRDARSRAAGPLAKTLTISGPN